MQTMNITELRSKIGQLWGLDRPITKAELARALRLSEKHGGDYVGRLEAGKVPINGAMQVALEALLDGWKPHNMDDVIKPGYPRGAVR